MTDQRVLSYAAAKEQTGTPPLAQLAVQVALAGIYFIAGKVGLSLAIVHPSASAVWPPTAIALVAVLWFGWRVAPAIFIGAFLVNLTTYGTLATSAGIATGNMLEALVGAALVQRYARGRAAFEQPGDVIRFAILAGLFSTLFSALIGVGSLSAAGLAPASDLFKIGLTWWLGNVSSNLILAPLLLVWLGRPLPSMSLRRAVEAAAMLLTVVLVGLVAVGGWFPASLRSYPLGYLGLIPLIWAAFRFGARGAATAASVMSAIAIGGVVEGHGPFVQVNPHESLLLLQAFMATITLTALVLAAVVQESDRTQEALLLASEDARAASAAKDRFLAVLSHELRTPLTPVLASLSLLETDRSLSPHVNDELSMIRRNVELEARLIDDLLDLNRIRHGKLDLKLEPVDVRKVIDSALHVQRGSKPPVRLITDFAAPNHWTRADPIRLEQVFRNLVSNAIKAMPSGGTLTIRTSDAADETLRIDVTDTGVGFAADVLPRLFQPFEQAHADAARFGGLGLGLSISRNIVEALGGTLEAHSEGVGRGATFTVILPTIAPPAARHAVPVPALRPTEPATSNGVLRILLVEDHRDTARALQRLLNHDGYAVWTAGTVADARRLAGEHAFDLVISDVGLPDGTGLELMRELKNQHDLPGIAVTGYGMEQDIRNSQDAGFAEHLTKPIDAARLQAAIERLLAVK